MAVAPLGTVREQMPPAQVVEVHFWMCVLAHLHRRSQRPLEELPPIHAHWEAPPSRFWELPLRLRRLPGVGGVGPPPTSGGATQRRSGPGSRFLALGDPLPPRAEDFREVKRAQTWRQAEVVSPPSGLGLGTTAARIRLISPSNSAIRCQRAGYGSPTGVPA